MQELVSVFMLAYNHEKWISKAIEGVINQKTNFKFKLYIHDDCSCDKTREIIIEYARQYPDLIELVLADENRYSQGIRVSLEIMAPIAQGKYVALCEGDDYWIDCNKLQKQIDYFENHTHCTLIFSNAKVIDTNDNNLGNFFPLNVWNDREINNKIQSKKEENFSIEEMILLDFVPTASLVFKKEIYSELGNFKKIIDIVYRLVATSQGYAHYFPNIFVAYRTGNENSASGSIQKSPVKLKENFYNLHCEILSEFDLHTNKKYHEIIQKEKERKLLLYKLKTGKIKDVIKNNDLYNLNKIYLIKGILQIFLKKYYVLLRQWYRKNKKIF